MSIPRAGLVYPWKSAQVLCTIVGFGFWEAYCGLDFPLIPMRLFRNIKYVAIVACASTGAVSPTLSISAAEFY